MTDEDDYRLEYADDERGWWIVPALTIVGVIGIIVYSLVTS